MRLVLFLAPRRDRFNADMQVAILDAEFATGNAILFANPGLPFPMTR
jgi:hypothetical protein